MSRIDVAKAAAVEERDVRLVSATEVRQALIGKVPTTVLDVATQQGQFWMAGKRYWLDDAEFGPPVDIEQLGYDPDLGLYLFK